MTTLLVIVIIRATNQYFADLYHCSVSAVKKWISALVKKGYISLELIYKEGTKQVLQRKLYINPSVNFYTTPYKNVHDPSVEMYTDNNKVINTKINNKLKVSKHKYGEYSHVLLTDKEHTHLLDLYGDSLDEHIKILDEYIETSGKKYKNHSLVIQKWVHDEWMKRNKDKPITLDSKFYAEKSTKTDKEVQDEFNRLRAQLFGA